MLHSIAIVVCTANNVAASRVSQRSYGEEEAIPQPLALIR